LFPQKKGGGVGKKTKFLVTQSLIFREKKGYLKDINLSGEKKGKRGKGGVHEKSPGWRKGKKPGKRSEKEGGKSKWGKGRVAISLTP